MSIGKQGKQTVLNAIEVLGLTPPQELIIEILTDLYKERLYKVIDDQTRVFNEEKLQATLDEFKTSKEKVTKGKNVKPADKE